MMFLVKETVPSNKWCSCPSRAQLEFFERSVTYLPRNGVIESYMCSNHGVTFKSGSWFNFLFGE